MTVRWTVRAADDRARSSCETESFPQRTLSDAVELSPSVLRRLENIVENSRSRGLSLRFLLIFFGHFAKTVINCFLLVYLPPCQIRNSRLIQSYRPTVFFLSLKISRKSLIYKFFCFGSAFWYMRCLYLVPRMS